MRERRPKRKKYGHTYENGKKKKLQKQNFEKLLCQI